MNGFQLWDPRKNEDYYFIDDTIREQFDIGGTSVFLYKYLGPIDQGNTNDLTQSNNNGKPKVTTIQDTLLLENRDRNYDLNTYEIKVVYTIQDAAFDLKQFSLFLDVDSLYIELHLNDCLEKIGRKLMSGDVLRFPHLRDDALLDVSAPALDKYYVVSDVARSASGYSHTWWPHILKAKLNPMTNSQEFASILNQKVDATTGEILPNNSIDPNTVTLGSILSDYNIQMDISNSILNQANDEVNLRNFETRHYYLDPSDSGSSYPWVYTEDGNPPNGLPLLGSGITFPDTYAEGDWFLRTDYEPEVLFKMESARWIVKEFNLRKPWEASNRLLTSFINNTKVENYEGEIFNQRQALSKIMKPRADF